MFHKFTYAISTITKGFAFTLTTLRYGVIIPAFREGVDAQGGAETRDFVFLIITIGHKGSKKCKNRGASGAR